MTNSSTTLLGTTRLSIAEIAYSCGFPWQSHMTDVFRCRVGATPAAVRKAGPGA
uniref:helix-turn-helix domain-containing protein n=1 Tax=Roseivivax sediminis TaxID=936889 RepID=UPI00122CECC9